MKKILLAVFTLALALGSSMPVYAATQTTTMPVSVTIAAAVTVSATGLNFGTIAAGGGIVYANSTITVNAASGQAYNVSLDGGLNFQSGVGRRLLAGALNGGTYYLYSDTGTTVQWGDSDFANTYPYALAKTGTGTGGNQSLPVYGKLYSGEVGVYTDTVTVTVDY